MIFAQRSKVRNKILGYFFLNEKRNAYVNELARFLDSDPKNVYRALLQLESENILKSEFRGKERYFSVDRKNPLYSHYKALFLKTAGLEYILKKKLEKIGHLSEAYIFGSYAQNKLNEKSDIDILMIGHHSSLEAQKVLYPLQKQVGREINAVHIKPEDLKKKKSSGDPLISGIFKKKVIKIL